MHKRQLITILGVIALAALVSLGCSFSSIGIQTVKVASSRSTTGPTT